MLKRALSMLLPDVYAESFKDINYKELYIRGIKGLIFDIDNTLEGYEAAVPSHDTAAFLMSLTDMGFKVCLVSNNNRERVERFNAVLGFPALYKAGKPGKTAVINAAAAMGVPAESIAFVGDQVFTDVLCGRRFCAFTALVRPVTPRDPWNVALKRIPERWVIKCFIKKV